MDNNWKQLLVEKLTELNSTRDSIQVTSCWCIFYRNSAETIVETWCRQFEKAVENSQISLLYLANDILLNSVERNGCESFVSEFWRVLPIYLKHIYQNGGQDIMDVASNLVGIWQDHNVFKSGHHNLRTHFLGESPTSMLPRKRKVEVRFEDGGSGKKILAAYKAAGEEHIDEDTILKAYGSSAKRVKEIENDVCNGWYLDIAQSIQLSDELIHEETVLWECANQLRSKEKATAAVLSQLREAIQREEYKLETIRDQLKDAEDEAENARRIRRMSLQNISDGSHTIYSQNSTVANTERTQIQPKPKPASTTSMGHKNGVLEQSIGVLGHQLKDAEDEAEYARRIRRMCLQNISDGSHTIYSQNSTVANTERTQIQPKPKPASTTSMGHKNGVLEQSIGVLGHQLKDDEDEAENARRIRMSLQNISDGSHTIYSQNSTVANTERTQIQPRPRLKPAPNWWWLFRFK